MERNNFFDVQNSGIKYVTMVPIATWPKASSVDSGARSSGGREGGSSQVKPDLTRDVTTHANSAERREEGRTPEP